MSFFIQCKNEFPKCLVQPPQVKPTEEEVRAYIKDDKLLLASGKKIPIVRNTCLEPLSGNRLKMPGVKGRVGEKTVDVLRDTGCSGIVVKKNLVSSCRSTPLDLFSVKLM